MQTKKESSLTPPPPPPSALRPPPPRSVDDLWEDCLVLIEELELRGELTEEEGALLRRLIDQRYGPLVNLFEGTTESRAHFVVGAKGLCAARR